MEGEGSDDKQSMKRRRRRRRNEEDSVNICTIFSRNQLILSCKESRTWENDSPFSLFLFSLSNLRKRKWETMEELFLAGMN